MLDIDQYLNVMSCFSLLCFECDWKACEYGTEDPIEYMFDLSWIPQELSGGAKHIACSFWSESTC